ncbi:hypothetical protein [Ligilactobacillus salivarius]|mgnify:FL=1|uniref:hypothetical protein n=1 Tax=Ligilactobacillus salivarius TaxID=1624 RepID=UPI0009D985F4|nr:hypothetical protein [Ligilactobacillus salivarius]MCR4912326.1 hypothetical protein [Lactobacillus sp.]OQQ93870.1 hypothetical protein B6U55_03810 [Ligilactobacillus salivarius]OYP91738.1 hypothetical protein B9G67_02750 [Ligilactobacillus salivarius]RHJ61342.1 hypothetical protein DW111_01440 [Ligilactobacillus salivarius]
MRGYIRKPSLKKSFKAATTAKYKRRLKKKLIPGYGTRTAVWLHPKRKLYNKVYHRTSKSLWDLFK